MACRQAATARPDHRTNRASCSARVTCLVAEVHLAQGEAAPSQTKSRLLTVSAAVLSAGGAPLARHIEEFMRVAGCAIFVQAGAFHGAGRRAPAKQGWHCKRSLRRAWRPAASYFLFLLQAKQRPCLVICCTLLSSTARHPAVCPPAGLRPHRDVRRHLCELPRHPGESHICPACSLQQASWQERWSASAGTAK